MHADRFRVLIAGGGFAGVEAALALRDQAPELVDVTLVSPHDELTYKPLVVEEPFGSQAAERHALEPLVAEIGGGFVRGSLIHVDPAEQRADVGGAEPLDYDALVVCVGAKPRVAFAHATTLRTSGEPIEIDVLLRDAAAHPSRRIAFVLPPGGSWPLPVYELALLGERRAAMLGLELTCMVVTPEEEPLIAFGKAASRAVSDLLRTRGVEVRSGVRPREGSDGALRLSPGDEVLEAGAVLALPALQGPAVSGLPADEAGFLPIDEHARVRGVEGVYAAGDGTNFPVKHGGIGTQQADAAAEHIAALAGADLTPAPFRPFIRGRLLTGDESLNLSSAMTGGTGEGAASPDPLWWPPQKVAGKYLAAFFAGTAPHEPGELPEHGIEVEAALPREWHRDPMALDPLAPPAID